MVKIVITLILLQLTISGLRSQSEYFTGLIIYKLEYTDPKTGGDLTASLAPILGSEQHYYVDSLNYKSYNENGVLTQLYNSETNKYYYTDIASKSVMEIDAREKVSNIMDTQKFDDTEEVLGIKCNKLHITTNMDTTTYWFSSSIEISSIPFKDHSFGHWNTYLKLTQGALPLKYISRTSFFIMTSTAIKIEKLPLTAKDFDMKVMLNKE